MNPRTWLTRWLPEPDGRAARLPLCLFGMMVTAVQTFGFVVFESLPLLAALPFSAFWILGWMAACDGRSLLVDLWRGHLIGPAQVEAILEDAAFATRRYTRRRHLSARRCGAGDNGESREHAVSASGPLTGYIAC